jgi:rhodanese-related sulfurtransferase
MTILSIEDLEKNKEILENLESAEINGVHIKNLKAIPMEMLIYLRKNLKEPYIHIEIKSNDDFFYYIENLEKFDKNHIYFITCSDGIRSSTLCDILRENGIECYWSINHL